MNDSIVEVKEGITKFFTGNMHDLTSAHSLRTLLKFYSLETTILGVPEINMKYGGRYSYLIVADKEESEMVIFVYKHSLYENEDMIAMYCVNGDFVYEYQPKEGKNFFSMNEWNGYLGMDMISSADDFRRGLISSSLKGVEEGVGFDIVYFTRNLSLF